MSLRVDNPSPAIRALAKRLVAGATTPETRALACFRFVRDEIHFGFTPCFDLANAEQTLAFRRGHCNPQAVLFASLLHAAGVEARLHLVTISNEILAGIFPPPGGPPARLAHTFTEVRLAGEWRRVDGYIVDPLLHARAVPRLRAEGRRLGWGVHVNGCIDWDGRSDCMVQFVDDEMLAGPDHGTTLDPAPFFASTANPQRLRIVSRLLYRVFAVAPANRTLDAMRRLDTLSATETEVARVVAGTIR